jgi:glucan phosphoethanolaminetransferase (alkaline phosphatase superfamily)
LNLKALSTSVTAIGIGVLILASSDAFAYAKNGSTVFSNLPTMGPGPLPVNMYLIAVMAVYLALILVAVVVRTRATLKKHIKIVGIVALIAIIAVASVSIVWFTEPSINYSIGSAYSYPGVGDNYLTVYCENVGYFSGTFDLVLQFEDANLSSSTSQPNLQLDSSTAKFTYTLQAGGNQSTVVYFLINDNVTDFYIFLSFQRSGSDFLIKSESIGDASVSYQKDASTGNFTERINPPPP